ncbi:MAG: deaminase [Spirochaetaceae bacterium]|nr:MAG: deaminase [Spirochaetaceae bacterium]
MGKLVYSFLTSLDGFVADEGGNFDWAMPDEEVHSFINDLERSVGTYLFGRKLYETMAIWETPDVFPDPSPAIREFARLWETADKIVFSKTLRTVTTKNTRIESEFDPTIVRELKDRSSRDVSIGGPTIASEAIRRGQGAIDVASCRITECPVRFRRRSDNAICFDSSSCRGRTGRRRRRAVERGAGRVCGVPRRTR